MDAKQIKAKLKDAREAIRVKDFEAAKIHCQAILEKEPTNYNALVFLGVSHEGLEQIDKALNAYKKATEQSPDQTLAWQGIATLLDKHANMMDLKEKITVFEKLQSFSSGSEGKRVTYLHKLVSLYQEADLNEKGYEVADELLDLEKDGEGRLLACKQMVDTLKLCNLSQDDVKGSKYTKCLKEILMSESLIDDDINVYTRLWLYYTGKNDNSDGLNAEELKSRFPKAIPPLEYILQTQLEKTIGVTKFGKFAMSDIEESLKLLEDLSPDIPVIKTAQGFIAWKNGKYAQAKQLFVDVSTSVISATYHLCLVELKLGRFSDCLDICTKGMENLTKPGTLLFRSEDDIAAMFKLVQADAHRHLNTDVDRAKSLDILEQISEKAGPRVNIIRAHLYLDEGELTEAQNCVDSIAIHDVEVKMVCVDIAMVQQQYKRVLTLTHEVLSEEPDHALATLKKGIALWELRHSAEIENVMQQCRTTLLTAAKLDPLNFESFLYLGKFYELIQKDLTKALRCYRKSYDLNPTSDAAGCSFVDSLIDHGEMDQALDILMAVTCKAPAGRVKWAWLRLGLHQIKHGDPSVAITSLQAALRADPKDNHVWECLSEAYLHRGSLTAALKAFTKASELNPDSVYCLYQIANIKQTLGLLSEAVQEYKVVLERDDSYVAALKGIGETLVLLAKQHLNQCLDGLAQDCVEAAIGYLTRAASVRPDFSCVWKLLGDCCTLISCLASNSYRVPSKLMNKETKDQAQIEVSQQQLLEIGGRSYSQAVKIMPENGSLWHNLAINLYRQACHLLRLSRSSDEDKESSDVRDLLTRSRKAMENALKLEPSNWRHWNGLGVVACSKVELKLPLAQHCFIKSIECEANNVLAWSNLGVLYLSQEEIGLSHDAFKVAQRLDPTFMVGWLGQALIAETVGDVEALDLFRHTTELGVHLESEIGFGHQVLSLLQDKAKQGTELFNYCIHRMAAIPAASDALIKYTARVQTDPVAYNMLGLLLEYQKLVQPAVQAFSRALSLLEDGERNDLKNQVRMNYARVLCSHGQYKNSLEQFAMLQSELPLENILMHALAAYKDEDFVLSFKLYKLTLEQAGGDDGLKSQIHAALAMVAFKAGDLEEAKTQLFNGFQTESPSLHGLLAMCALGLHQSDITLAEAALDELSKRQDGQEVMEKIAAVTLYKHVLEDNTGQGESLLKTLIETYPQCGRKLWLVLASFLLNGWSNRSKGVLDCLNEIKKNFGNLEHTELVVKTVAQLQGGTHSPSNTDNNAFKSAQRAFHQNPGDTPTLTAFVSALHAEGVLRKPSNRHTDLFKTEFGLLQMLVASQQAAHSEDAYTTPLISWCLHQLVICAVEAGLEDDARQLLGHLKEKQGNSNELVEALTRLLYATPIDEWSRLENLMAIQVVCNVMCDEESVASTINTILKPLVEHPEGKQETSLSKSKLLELWTHTTFHAIQRKAKGLNELRDLFKEGVSNADRGEIKSAIISILKGVHGFKGEKKDAKKYFATALDQTDGRLEADGIKSVARRGLIALLADSTKNSDQKLIEALVKDAESEMDAETLELHKSIFKK